MAEEATEAVQNTLYRKTKQCTNPQHARAPEQVRKNCVFWHDEDMDRFAVVGGKRQRWSPAVQNQIIREQQAADILRQKQWEERRQNRIADLKLRPNYKTAPCQNPDKDNADLHDQDLCAFSHGHDFNEEGYKQLLINRPPRAAAAPKGEDRHVHASERRQAFNATRETNIEYEAVFPPLASN